MLKKSHNEKVHSVQYVPPSTRTCNVIVSTTTTRIENEKRMESMIVKECHMKNLKKKFHLQDIGKNGVMILKSMWNQFNARVRPWTEFNCLTQGTNGKKRHFWAS